jgi:hypothetical protein
MLAGILDNIFYYTASVLHCTTAMACIHSAVEQILSCFNTNIIVSKSKFCLPAPQYWGI